MSDTNAGPGMAPCRKGCRCNDCEIDRLTERIAELEAENERLDDVIQAEKERRTDSDCMAIKAEQRADTLQAQLDAVRGLPVKTAGDIYWEQEHGENCLALYVDVADLQQALNAPETA